MGIRKYICILNAKEKEIIGLEIEEILKKCDKISDDEWKDQREAEKIHNGRCPKCRADQKDIVDKIRQVHGDGNVSGSFNLGFGSVSGSMSIDTNEVNHCNKCGNEWKKFKTKYVDKTKILKVALNYLGEIYENPEVQKGYSWKMNAIKVFDGCTAETISTLVEKHKNKLYSSTKEQLILTNLRKNYRSIFDPLNKIKLEKL